MDVLGHDAESFEAGALAALEHITDERPDLEDVTMRAAEKIGADVLKLADQPRGAVEHEGSELDDFIEHQWNPFISALHVAVGKPAEGLDWGELVAEVEQLRGGGQS
jgi:hypothetical protein